MTITTDAVITTPADDVVVTDDMFTLVSEGYGEYEHGTFFRDAEGHLYVAADNETADGSGVYMMGDNTDDESLFRQLQELDPKKRNQEGDCLLFAWELYARCEHVVAVDELRNDEGLLYHAVARLRNGDYADSLGIWSEGGLMAYWEAVAEKIDGEYDFELQTQEDLEGMNDQQFLRPPENSDDVKHTAIGDALIAYLNERFG